MFEHALDEIKAFVAERDAMLTDGSLAAVKAFYKKHNPNIPLPTDDVLENAMHKARTACKSLPIELRRASRDWLKARNAITFDDGDLNES